MEKKILFKDIIGFSFKSLLENRLRTFLTLLGLAIGVMSLITVMTVIEGANQYVANEIANLGSNVFKITKLANISEGINKFIKSFRRKDITWQNYRYLKENLKNAIGVGAQVSIGATIRYGDDYIDDTSIRGTTSNMVDIEAIDIQDGRFFNKQEQDYARRVCVIGWDVKDHLFAAIDPIGKYLKVNNRPYLIIGLCKKKGSILGQTQDNFVLIPISVFFKQFGSHRSLDIYVQCSSPLTMQQLMDQAKVYLRNVRHRKYDQDDDFTFVTSDTTISLFHSITDNFFLVFIMLTAVAAVVGGIVIMNIMLVSVSDRTMEIGVRRAVGASRKDILYQFLTESVLLCVIGGAVGVGVGFAVAYGVSELGGIPAGVKLWVAGFGLFTSSFIGLFFGIYPAWKASALDPVEALRKTK